MEKVAIIEMNEVNVKLTILSVEQNQYFNVTDEISENLQLGVCIEKEGLISASKVTETLSILKMFRKVSENSKVTKFYAIASNFIKEAKNQKSFFDEIYNNTSLSFTILSMEEEVRAIYSGVVNSIDVPKGIIIDVEPNHTHIIHYNRRTILSTFTYPKGAVTFAESNSSMDDIVAEIKKWVSGIDYLKTLEEDTLFVGSGEIMLACGRLAKKVTHYPLNVDNNYIVSSEVFGAVYQKLKETEIDKTSKLKGISEERADAIVLGMAISKAIIDELKVSSFSVCARGKSEGLIYNYIVPETNEKPLSDMLSYSLETIRTFYDRPFSNTENVYNLCIIMFKQLKVIHKLPRAYVKALRIAASMYDCGTRVNYDNYSNYSFDIVVNSKLCGVSHRDLLLAAFACKYQNLNNITLSEWVKYKDILTEEDLEAVRKMAVIINLCANLDKSKSGNVTDVCCDILGDSIIMKTVVNADASFDIRQGMRVGPDSKKIWKKYFKII